MPGSPGARLVLADVAYRAGEGERYLLLDGEPDWGALLHALAGAPLAGEAGRLELRPGPALAALLPAPGTPARVPSTDQSNTLLAVGALLLKLYRRPEAGPHPEVEACAALAGTRAPVPAFAGALWHVAADGAETAVALLQAFVPDAESGWEAPIERAAAWLRAPGDAEAVAAEHRALGATAAALRDALAAALGAAPAGPGTAARWLADARAVLAQAAAADPEAAQAVAEIEARLAPLGDAAGLPVARVHGDLHVAQVLRAGDVVRVIDFEGDPTRPLAERRRPDTPLRDLACLLRSVDHVGIAAARRAQREPGAWIAIARAAVLDGWGERPEPRLLHALELAKACQELVYAARVVPEWAYAPRGGLRRLLTTDPGRTG